MESLLPIEVCEISYAAHLCDYYIRPTDSHVVLVFTLYDDYKPSKANLFEPFCQPLDAVCQLHAVNIVHCNIKLTNLL